MKYLFIIAMMAPATLLAQVNLVRNGSFEGDFISTTPMNGEDLYQNPPPEWEEYKLTNSDDDEAWLTDSVFVWTNINLPNTPYNNAFYSLGCGFTPFDSASGNILMPASVGRFFAGFNNSNDGTREGIQQDLGCKLNSGDYTLQYDWARPYVCNGAGFKVHISEDKDTRRKQISSQNSTVNNTQPGAWYFATESFSLDLNGAQDMDNRWLVFTGDLTLANDLSKYIYLDNVHLFRWCDVQNQCIRTTGQICPVISSHFAPLDPLTIIGMDNVASLRIKLYDDLARTIMDTTHTNANGIPPFTLSRLSLPPNTASGTYHYDVELTNDCGALRQTGTLVVQDTALYNLTPPWIDSTAHWSPMPIPCCLDSLTLSNVTIRGDVSYIVRDQITVQSGVSIASNSHVTLQAGNVVEIHQAEFDGSNSTLEILEIPCPQRQAQGQTCNGGHATIDGGEVVLPPLDSAFLVMATHNLSIGMTQAQADLHAETSMGFQLGTKETPGLPTISISPNPAYQDVDITLQLPVAETVALSLLDLRQQPVRQLFTAQPLPAGNYSQRVQLHELPLGVYLVQLCAGDAIIHARLVRL